MKESKSELIIAQLKEEYLNKLNDEIVKEVINILKRHKNLIRYIDYMGSSFFVDKNGNYVDLHESDYKYLQRLQRLYKIEPRFQTGEEITLKTVQK